MNLFKLNLFTECPPINQFHSSILGTSQNCAFSPIQSCNSRRMQYTHIERSFLVIIVNSQTSIIVSNADIFIGRTAFDGIYLGTLDPKVAVYFGIFGLKSTETVLVDLMFWCCKYDIVVVPLKQVGVKVVSPVFEFDRFEGFGGYFSLGLAPLFYSLRAFTQHYLERFLILW